MRNHVLNIGVAIFALSCLPSCVTNPADEAKDVSEVESTGASSERAGEPGIEVRAPDVKSTEQGSTSNEDGRNGLVEAETSTSLLGCGLNPYNNRTCYYLYNCWGHVVDWVVVKYNGNMTGCVRLQSGGVYQNCLANGQASHIETCPW